MKQKKTPENLRILLELRRSNSATPISNKKKYSKKTRQNIKKMLKLNNIERDPLD